MEKYEKPILELINLPLEQSMLYASVGNEDEYLGTGGGDTNESGTY